MTRTTACVADRTLIVRSLNLAQQADGTDVDMIRRQLDELQQRVDGLAAYREMDAQTTLRIEHQIELIQLQIDKLADLIGRIGNIIDAEK